MSTTCEVVVYADNGERHPLSLECELGDLSWETKWDTAIAGGCQEMRFAVRWDPRDAPPVIDLGRRIEVWDGLAVPYAGAITDIEPGDTAWTITAWGLASAAVAPGFVCMDAASAPNSVPDTSIDQAILRGLPWARTASVSAVAYSGTTSPTVFNPLATLLNDYTKSVGKRWAVWPGLNPGDPGQLVVATDPTIPDYLLLASSGIMGVADPDFVTDVYARYLSSTTSAMATVTSSNAATRTRWKRRESGLDLTNLGAVTAAKAQTISDGKLALAGARMSWTRGFDASPIDLVDPGGAPARLSLVHGGQMVRICGVVDVYGQLLPGVVMDIVIGETKYVDGAPTIAITPVGLTERDLLSVLSIAEPDEFVAA